MILVDDEKFYQGLRTDGIYKYFRSKGKLTGSIIKPTGKSVKNDITIKGEYYIDWIKISNKYRYTLIDSTL